MIITYKAQNVNMTFCETVIVAPGDNQWVYVFQMVSGKDVTIRVPYYNRNDMLKLTSSIEKWMKEGQDEKSS